MRFHKFKILLFLNVLMFNTLMSADALNDFYEYKPVYDYLCVNYDENKLIIPGDSYLLKDLYKKIDKISATGQGKLSILHIGGSHVQAGVFSHRLRVNFRNFIGDYTASKGAIFPFKSMGTNAPKNYSMIATTKCDKARCTDKVPLLPLGLKGAALSIVDSSTIVKFDLNSTEEELWQYDKLTILGDAKNGSIYPLLILENDTLHPKKLENSAYVFELPTMVSNGQILFSGLLTKNDSFIFRGIIPENSNSGLTYHEAGINGATVSSWLRCDYFDKEIQHINPDVVIFAIGINDANVSPVKFDNNKFKSNYRKLIDKIKRINPNVLCLFVTNNDCKLNIKGYRGQFNPNTQHAEQAFIELAKEYNGVVWDLYKVMGGFGSSEQWVDSQLMQPDYIHFKREGYELLGDLLYNAFVINYRNIGYNE